MHHIRTAIHALATLAIVVGLAACNQTPTPTPTIDLQATGTTLSVQPGQSSSLAIEIAPYQGFTGTVTLSLLDNQGNPASDFTLTPNTVDVNSAQPVLTAIALQANSTATIGNHPLLLEARANGTSSSLPLSVTVGTNPSPDFSLDASPLSLTTTPGVNISTVLLIAPQNGFTGTINLSVTDNNGQPVNGMSLSPTTVTVATGQSAGQAVTITTGSYLSGGTYDLRLTASGNSVTHTIPLALTLTTTGTGTFQTQTTFPVGSRPLSLAIADVNGDGRPDITTANQNDNTVSVLLGNGDGTFTTKSTPTVGTNPTSIAIADLNNDGNPDITTANDGAGTVTVLLGNGDGTFTTKSTPTVGTNPHGIAIADLNGDGRPDITTANYTTAGTVTVLIAK